MVEREEDKLHMKMKKLEGEWQVNTEWGKMNITLEAIPNYAGGKGCPDELLIVKINFSMLGINVKLSAPILIELEKSGYSGAKEDLEKFCKRSLSKEQISYLEIPMIVISNDYKRIRVKEKELMARFNMIQIPARILNDD